jgi:hypothetical protein
MSACVNIACRNKSHVRRWNYRQFRQSLLVAVLASVLLPSWTATAEIMEEAVVGVTPVCQGGLQYGLAQCWGAVAPALGRIEDIASVTENPLPSDLAMSVIRVRLKPNKVPDLEKWREQFAKAVLGEQYKTDTEAAEFQRKVIRGVEISVKGKIKVVDGRLVLYVPGDSDFPEFNLVSLKDPVQHRPAEGGPSYTRGAQYGGPTLPEDPERSLKTLHAIATRNANAPFEALVTGPIRIENEKATIEVRDFVPTAP